MSQSQNEEQKVVDYQALRQELTKRNADYIYRVEKFLQEQKLTTEQATEKVNEHLEEIIDQQRKGRPANKMYGSASQFADQLLNKKQKPQIQNYEAYPYWKLAIDSGLFYGVMFSVLIGLAGLFTTSQANANQFGLVTILLVAVLFGGIMPYYNMMLQKPKSQRPAWWKLILYFVAVILIYFALTAGTVYLPEILNPKLSPIGMLIMAVVLFAIRYAFRKYYDIKVSPLNPTNAGRK